MKAVWISWESHRRAREIARALNIPLFEVSPDFTGVVRYGPMMLRTTLRLFTERPTHLFVQCPSVVLGLWAVLLKRVFRYVLIADLHNEAVEPFINKSQLYHWIVRKVHLHADCSIVSNPGLCGTVERNGGRTFVLPDRVPALGSLIADPDRGTSLRVVFVCTFAPDEPYEQVFAAARILGPRVGVYVTGRKPREVSDGIPGNVTLTGYLPDEDYERLLRDADAIMDLTAMENCLVCGAYEAVALQKPLVTSDTVALRCHFRRGTVFVRHDARSIAAGVASALDQRAELAGEMRTLREELDAEWAVAAAEFMEAFAPTQPGSLGNQQRGATRQSAMGPTRRRQLPDEEPQVD